MTYLYLVRHGQADRLGKDYDQLTELGHKQANALGNYFLSQNIEFDSVFTGSLKRQKQTMEGIAKAFQTEQFCMPESIVNESWNEFDPKMWLTLAAKIRHVDSDFANNYKNYKEAWEQKSPTTRDHFQLLIQKVLADWVNGVWDPVEPYTFKEYVDLILGGLASIPENMKSTLVVSSSTPVAIVMGISCKLKMEDYPIFMKYILNSSLSIFKKSAGIWEPVSFNGTPHLMNPEDKTIV